MTVFFFNIFYTNDCLVTIQRKNINLLFLKLI